PVHHGQVISVLRGRGRRRQRLGPRLLPRENRFRHEDRQTTDRLPPGSHRVWLGRRGFGAANVARGDQQTHMKFSAKKRLQSVLGLRVTDRQFYAAHAARAKNAVAVLKSTSATLSLDLLHPEPELVGH